MIHILVHDKKDTVGVAVVEGIKAGQELTGWVTLTFARCGSTAVAA